MTPGAVLIAETCDGCGRRALCVPIPDEGDGGLSFLCGRCASTGRTVAPEERLPRPVHIVR